MAKTDADLTPEALEIESMIAGETYDTPRYHSLVVMLHRALGPCGCYSCGREKKAAA